MQSLSSPQLHNATKAVSAMEVRNATNAGVDHVSTFSKMTVLEMPGDRVLVDVHGPWLAPA